MKAQQENKQQMGQQRDTPIVAAAREYVQKQLEIMREFGSAPNLSREAYEEIVEEVAEAAHR